MVQSDWDENLFFSALDPPGCFSSELSCPFYKYKTMPSPQPSEIIVQPTIYMPVDTQ